MIQFSLSASISDLLGILTLQQENLLSLLSEEEKRDQGFVTVQHTQEQLERMHEITPHVLAKIEAEIVGYVLAMTLDSRNLVPSLIPLFMNFEKLVLRGKKVIDYQPMVIGQVCVANPNVEQAYLTNCVQLIGSSMLQPMTLRLPPLP